MVALGDSITDGHCSQSNLNHRYPDYLAQRLRARNMHISLVNKGMSGNRLLHEYYGPSALARFDRDVLAVPGVCYVILHEDINDIGLPGWTHQAMWQVTAQQIESGLKQLVERSHEHGMKVMGGTLTPFKGSMPGYYTPAGEQVRKGVNQWIRTSGTFDAVVDFDKALTDADAHIRPEFDCGDHLHPNDKGYKAMADAVDLTFFKK